MERDRIAMETPSVICYGRRDTPPEGYHRFNVTSRSQINAWKSLSPFILGPVGVELLESRNVEANVMENGYQFSKIYPGQSAEDWARWSDAGMKCRTAQRFPMGRGVKPLGSVHKGNILGYIEARHKVYAPMYVRAIMRSQIASESITRLREMYLNGKKIALYDFDGYAWWKAGLDLEEVIYNRKRIMGHSFIIIGLITNNEFWKKPYEKAKEFEESIPLMKGY